MLNASVDLPAAVQDHAGLIASGLVGKGAYGPAIFLKNPGAATATW